MANRDWVRILMAVLLFAGLLVTALPDLGQAEEKADGGLATEPTRIESAPESAPMTEPGQKKTLLGPFTLQVGFKTWYTQWQTRTGGTTATGMNQQTSVFSPMMGPQITLGYTRPGGGDWFRGAYVSYQYLNSSFDLHQFGSPTSGLTTEARSATRSDTTVTVSLPVYKGYGVFGGYYQSLQRFQFPQFGTATETALLFKGPVVGAFGSQPIPDTRASLYGNAGVGWLSLHPAQPGGQGTNQNFRTDSVMAYSVETGVNYSLPEFWKMRPSAQIGFRAQVLQQTFGSSVCTGGPCPNGPRANDILWGPTFMIATAF